MSRINGVTYMGSRTDKVSGIANQAIGKTKQVIGKLIGSNKLEAKGVAQEIRGNAQHVAGKEKETVRGSTSAGVAGVKKGL